MPVAQQFLIKVGQGRKVGEGVHAHTVFGVTSQLFTVEPITLDRRYSDFVWLHEQLHRVCMGCILPPLPEKAVNALQSASFLERRRMELQRFLQSVQRHEILSKSTCFQHFLTSKAVEFTAIKAESHTTTKTYQKDALSNWWGKTVQKLTENQNVQLLAAKAGKDLTINKTNQDAEFDGILLYIGTLLTDLKNLEGRAQCVYQNGYTLATSLFELAASVSVLAESEVHEPGMRSAQLNCIEPILKERARQVELEIYPFLEEISYLVKCVVEAQTALKDREEARFAYQASKAQVKKITSMEIQAGSTALADAQRKQEDTKRLFESIHDRVTKEMAKFRIEKGKKFRRIFAQFAELQMEFNKDMVKTLALSIPIACGDDDESYDECTSKLLPLSAPRVLPRPLKVVRESENTVPTTSLMVEEEPSRNYADIAL